MTAHKLYDKIRNTIPFLPGWCTPEKAQALAREIVKNNYQDILEIGIFGGRSVIAMAMACRWKGSGHVWGIDPWRVADCLESDTDKVNSEWWSQKVDLEEIYHTFVMAVCNQGLLPWTTWFRANSKQVAGAFTFLDVLHVDGNHTEDVCRRDLELYAPKVRSGGLLVMDDINWAGPKACIPWVLDQGFKEMYKVDSGACGFYKKL